LIYSWSNLYCFLFFCCFGFSLLFFSHCHKFQGLIMYMDFFLKRSFYNHKFLPNHMLAACNKFCYVSFDFILKVISKFFCEFFDFLVTKNCVI
jgi:hypothetical protein